MRAVALTLATIELQNEDTDSRPAPPASPSMISGKQQLGEAGPREMIFGAVEAWQEASSLVNVPGLG